MCPYISRLFVIVVKIKNIEKIACWHNYYIWSSIKTIVKKISKIIFPVTLKID